MSRRFNYFIAIVFYTVASISMFGQEKMDTVPKQSISIEEGYLVNKEKDTLQIELDDIWLIPKIHFSSAEVRKEYLITRRRVYKVYPFAALAAERMEIVDDLLETLPDKRSQRVYLRRAQKFMQEEFTDTLKDFTRSEGRILFKLIYRQTGQTTFDLIKEYRSGWNAFWFNTAASVYDLTMKQTFDPYTVREDYYIEDILQRAFGDGRLEEQDPAIPIDLREMYNIWRNEGKDKTNK